MSQQFINYIADKSYKKKIANIVATKNPQFLDKQPYSLQGKKLANKLVKIVIVFGFSSIMLKSNAQVNSQAINQPSNKKLTGCYSDESKSFSLTSMCLFEDGTYFYPSHINQSGKYKTEGNQIVFEPKNRGFFEVYGRYDPEVASKGQGTRFYFSGFDSESLMNFDRQGFKVMPLKTGCQGGFKLHKYNHNANVRRLDLANAPHETDSFTVFNYTLDVTINDVLLIAQNPKKEVANFTGKVIMDAGDVWLQLGKNVLSMQKIEFSTAKLEIVKKIGLDAVKIENSYELLNQDNLPSFQGLNRYSLDKMSNRYLSKMQASNQPTANNQNHYLKMYEKINSTAQSMSTASVEVRKMPEQPKCEL